MPLGNIDLFSVQLHTVSCIERDWNSVIQVSSPNCNMKKPHRPIPQCLNLVFCSFLWIEIMTTHAGKSFKTCSWVLTSINVIISTWYCSTIVCLRILNTYIYLNITSTLWREGKPWRCAFRVITVDLTYVSNCLSPIQQQATAAREDFSK